MKNCMEYQALIPEYLDGELDKTQRIALEEHIDGCTSCKKALEETRALFGDVRAAAEDVPDELMKSVMALVRTENHIKKRRRANTVRALGGLAACFAIIAGIAAAAPFIWDDEEHMMGGDCDGSNMSPATSNVKDNSGGNWGKEQVGDEDIFMGGSLDSPELAPEETFAEAEASDGRDDDAEYEDSADVGASPGATEGRLDSSSTSASQNSSGIGQYGEVSDIEVESTSTDFSDYSGILSDDLQIDLGAYFMKKGAGKLAELLEETE